MVALVLLGLLLALGIASILGLTTDSRDASYQLGSVIDGHRDADRPSTPSNDD